MTKCLGTGVPAVPTGRASSKITQPVSGKTTVVLGGRLSPITTPM